MWSLHRVCAVTPLLMQFPQPHGEGVTLYMRGLTGLDQMEREVAGGGVAAELWGRASTHLCTKGP